MGQHQDYTLRHALSYLIRKIGCNVYVDPSFHQSKYSSFNKHAFGCIQYIKDAQGNYVKKSGKELEQPKPREPMDDVLEPLVQDPRLATLDD